MRHIIKASGGPGALKLGTPSGYDDHLTPSHPSLRQKRRETGQVGSIP